MSLDDLFARIKEGGLKELNIIIKGDVQGSVGALADALNKVEQTEVRLRVIHTGVGAINESDVMLASASEAIIIGFNVRPRPEASILAEREKVDIRTYRVIYRAIEDVRDALVGLLEPDIVEDVIGHARGARHLPREPHRHDRRLLRHRRASSAATPACASCARAWSSTRARSPRSSASTRTPARWRPGFECGVLIENYNDVKEERRARGLRAPRGRAHGADGGARAAASGGPGGVGARGDSEPAAETE